MPRKNKKTPACPECGGKKRGRGFSHKDGCSLAKSSGSIARRRRSRVAKTASGDHVSKLILGEFRRLPIETLIDFKRAVDVALASRRGEVQRMIGHLRQSLRG